MLLELLSRDVCAKRGKTKKPLKKRYRLFSVVRKLFEILAVPIINMSTFEFIISCAAVIIRTYEQTLK